MTVATVATVATVVVELRILNIEEKNMFFFLNINFGNFKLLRFFFFFLIYFFVFVFWIFCTF